MEPIFQSLDTPWQRIYFDLPGMGKTKGQPWITGTDQMLDLILEFIDGIIPNQHFVVAGESYGGYLARGVIKERASLVDGLLLICPVAIQETHRANSPALQVLEKDEALLNSLSEEDRQYFEGITVLQNKRVWERFKEDILPGLKIADYAFLENSLGATCPLHRQCRPDRETLHAAHTHDHGKTGFCRLAIATIGSSLKTIPELPL